MAAVADDPAAVAAMEAVMDVASSTSSSDQEEEDEGQFVYDVYMPIDEDDGDGVDVGGASSGDVPVIEVCEEEDEDAWWMQPDDEAMNSDHDSEDSNAESFYANSYPDEDEDGDTDEDDEDGGGRGGYGGYGSSDESDGDDGAPGAFYPPSAYCSGPAQARSSGRKPSTRSKAWEADEDYDLTVDDEEEDVAAAGGVVNKATGGYRSRLAAAAGDAKLGGAAAADGNGAPPGAAAHAAPGVYGSTQQADYWRRMLGV